MTKRHPLVNDNDEKAARDFFASWPKVTIPDYLPEALAESFALYRRSIERGIYDQKEPTND